MIGVISLLVSIGLLGQVAAGPVPAQRVACVGDSITYGYGLKKREKDCFPAKLAKLLGGGYEVGNFGVSGATVIKRGTRPYVDQEAFQDSLRFQPDVVVIALGTNDTNPQTWPQFGRDFRADLTSLIQSFRDANPHVQIVVCLPPPLFRDRGKTYDTDAILAQQIIPQIEDVARRSKAPVVDLYHGLDDHSAYFADGVHPDAEGAAAIAAMVSQRVRPAVADTQPAEQP